MDKDEALRIALEALVDFEWHIENCPQFPTWAEPENHPSCTCGYDTAITALRQALEQPEREWQGLTDEEIAEGAKQSWVDKQAFESAVWWAEEKLREKNGF